MGDDLGLRVLRIKAQARHERLQAEAERLALLIEADPQSKALRINLAAMQKMLYQSQQALDHMGMDIPTASK